LGKEKGEKSFQKWSVGDETPFITSEHKDEELDVIHLLLYALSLSQHIIRLVVELLTNSINIFVHLPK
jgi:hypothetical protein